MQTEMATILGDATIQEAVSLMRYEGVRSLLIVPRDGEQDFGIITYSDIVEKIIAERLDPRAITVDEIARPRAQSIPAEMDVQTIAGFFRDQKFGHAPVVDRHGKVMGMVSMTDLITEVITEPD